VCKRKYVIVSVCLEKVTKYFALLIRIERKDGKNARRSERDAMVGARQSLKVETNLKKHQGCSGVYA
jgi:hypothetical protein